MMKKTRFNLFCLFCLSLLISSKPADDRAGDIPAIVAGTSKITGRIKSPKDPGKDSIFVMLTVLPPISGENVKHTVLADKSGKFSLEVDVETDISLIGLYTSVNLYAPLLIKLMSGEVTNVDITYNSDEVIENVEVTPHMNIHDMIRHSENMSNMIDYTSGRPQEAMYNKSPDYFLNFAKNSLSERLLIANNDTLISKELKGILAKDFRLYLYSTYVFDYEKFMVNNFRNLMREESKMPGLQKIDKTYYKFLKDFNLNDPEYLHAFTFPEFQNEILRNETLRLPDIGDSDIPSWLANVKVILADLIGFDKGPYYDVLAANAYGRQMNEEVKPLTEKQRENITKYWKNGEIAKILFRKNRQVAELDKLRSPVVVYDISSVPDDKVMETILSKHKNKVIFIDLWATWCGPCLEAMREFRSAKNELRNKEISFVYLSNRSSPRKLWEEKIKGIGNEHYYLTDSQWEHVMNQFDFDAIPSYLLYNKEGLFINKFTAFPGNEKVKKMINDLL